MGMLCSEVPKKCSKTQAKLKNGSLCKECCTINDNNEFIIIYEINSEDSISPFLHTNSYDREIIEVLIEGMIQEKYRELLL